MKRQLFRCLVYLAFLCLLSCHDGGEDPAPQGSQDGEAILNASSETCSSYGIGGTYNINEPLTKDHSIGVTVNVTKTGTYTISTDTVNGYSFKGSGTFSKTGDQAVTLAGSGTPVISGTDVFTVRLGLSSCNISVTVKDNTDYSSRIILATGEAHMADNYTLYAFNGNKQLLWTKTGFSNIPAVHNGIAYLTLNGNLQAVNIVTGEMIWENATISEFSNAVAYADSTLYLSGTQGSVYAVDAGNGVVKWTYFSGSYGVMSSSPTVVDNVIYVGGNRGKLFALNTDGTEKWVYIIPNVTSSVRSSPAVVNNVIYFGNDNGSLYAIKTDGSALWSADVGLSGEQSPTVSGDKVYIEGNEKLYCLNAASGAVIWEYSNQYMDNDWSSPMVSNGTVYASGMGEGLLAIDAATGTKLWNNNSAAATADEDPVIHGNLAYIAGPGGISAVNAVSGATLWNYGYLNAGTSPSAVFETPAVVYDRLTRTVSYPATSGNVQ